jgi:DNA-binding GntR family transcriptional regulator
MEAEDDLGKWTDYNRQFHAALAERVPAPRLLAILGRLRDSAAPYTGLSIAANEHRAEASADHREMLDVLRARDGKRLAEIAERHLDLTIAVLEESRELFEAPADR